ncbi:MAG TPA: methyltransferase [Candidatus Acidoferrales bacterium]|nr:methyltransferase [Candidatus Acidoferrales bacterium]
MSTNPAQALAAPASLNEIFAILRGFWASRALAVAAELELADLLADRPLSVDALAQRTRTHAPSLFRVIRALESIGVFRQISPRVFANTPTSELLRKGVPGSQWAFVRMILSSDMGQFDAFGALLSSVRTGKPSFDEVHGCGGWDYYRRQPEKLAIFNEAMRSASAAISPAVAAAYDWKKFPVIADIAGGIGSQLVAILDVNPSIRGILFDQPQVVANAIEHPRVERVAGDFFKSVPAGADAYTMRWIIHDWPDAESIAIMTVIRKAMKPAGRLILIEEIVPETPELTWAKWLDLQMLVGPGGQERTESEYRELLSKAGLQLDQIVPTPAGSSLLIARPAGGG